jgi:transcriptional regulator of acetoin/glycerol metabolism
VLDATNFNITQAARILDIDRVTLYNKIKKYHLREPA